MENDISEEMIQQQMQETRASLTEKLETLEQKVVGTVENATAAVNETVDVIKETVNETVATVQEGVKGSVDSVKEFVDVPGHVDRHPWMMVGGSMAVGYCLSTLLSQKPSASSAVPTYQPGPVLTASSRARPDVPSQAAQSIATPAPSGVWAPEIAKLKGLALGVLFGTARELLVSSVPEHMGDQLRDVVDSATRKVGGQPLPSSDWAKLREMASQADEAMSVQSPAETVADPLQKQGDKPRSEMDNGHHAARRW